MVVKDAKWRMAILVTVFLWIHILIKKSLRIFLKAICSSLGVCCLPSVR